MTCDGLTSVMEEIKPQIMSTVPYGLKLLAEQDKGIEALRRCDYVSATGSQTPDDLGDRLVERGVNLSIFMGSYVSNPALSMVPSLQEHCVGRNVVLSVRQHTGQKTTRPGTTYAPPPPMINNIWPKPIGDGTFEFVYLKGYPTKNISNSDDPPDSYHSKDIFVPHTTIPNAWKFITRIDDRVTLLNGEKVLPLPIEGRIRRHPLVREAIVFGIGMSVPGLLLFRAEAARDMADYSFLDEVYSVIVEANKSAESFSQISRDMVVPLPADAQYPLTDKGSIIRARTYKMFEKEIEKAYQNMEGTLEGENVLDIPGLEKYLVNLSGEILGSSSLADTSDDFFAHGMNSLQAIQMRGRLLRHLELGGNGKHVSQNVVFEQGNVANLAKHLNEIRIGATSGKEKPIALMKEFSVKYAVRPIAREPSNPEPAKNVIVSRSAHHRNLTSTLTHF